MEARKESHTSVLIQLQGTSFFGCLVHGTPFVIPALSGKAPPIETVEGFTCPRFDVLSPPTVETIVDAYEICEPVTFREAFRALSNRIAYFALTECQIVEFINTHIELLRAVKRPTFFLCMADKQFFIVLIVFWGEFPHVSRFPIDHHYKLEPQSHYRLIVPKQNPE